MPPSRHERFRRFTIWYVAILGGFAILLLGMLVLMAYAFDGSVTVYVDTFGEARLELIIFAVVIGTVPFGLYVLDEQLR